MRCLFSAILTFLICVTGRTAHAVESVSPAASAPVADTTRAVSGLSGWVVELYHYDLFWYGLAVVGVMAVMGVILGFAMDRLVSRIGIDLGRLEHRE
jgi:hypothetical protein